jgi:hypothetical protein
VNIKKRLHKAGPGQNIHVVPLDELPEIVADLDDEHILNMAMEMAEHLGKVLVALDGGDPEQVAVSLGAMTAPGDKAFRGPPLVCVSLAERARRQWLAFDFREPAQVPPEALVMGMKQAWASVLELDADVVVVSITPSKEGE